MMRSVSRHSLAAIPALLSCVLSGCRHRAPVTRHFLRIPAETTGGLSGIQRAQWLKASRRSLPPRKTLAATGYLSLPGTSTNRGKVFQGLEMLHVPGEGGNGGLAVVVPPGENVGGRPRLHLLEHRRFIYTETSSKVLGSRVLASAWHIDPARKSITAYGAGSTSTLEVIWNGHAWVLRSAR